MNGCDSNYKQVPIEEKDNEANNMFSWKPFLRQLLVCSGVSTSFFVSGLCLGAPTVFIPQIRKEANSTDAITEDMASWLSSAMSFSAFFLVTVISILTKLIGRKICFVIACIITFLALLLFYCSTTVTQILISQIAQGVLAANQYIVSISIITEYTSPKYRGIFLIFKLATLHWGVLVANAIGTFFHWKQIGLLGIICTCYILATVFIWPESPYWLASRERYKECRASHRWLKGNGNDSEKELETLINTQKAYIRDCGTEKLSLLRTFKFWFTAMTSREFYKPTLISMLLGVLQLFSGKIVCTIYALDILKKITGSKSTAYTALLILDGITVLSMYASCIVSKFFKRRTLLLVTSSIAVLFLFITSLYLYLVHLSVLIENKYVSIGLLLLFSIFISCGPVVLAASTHTELIPLRSRNFAICILSLNYKFLLSVMLKVAPSAIKRLGLHGTYLFFGVSSSICILLLYKYLPETKDRTLLEIADSMIGINLNVKNIKETEKFVPKDLATNIKS